MKRDGWSTWRQRLRRVAAPDLAVALLIAGYAAFFSAYTLALHQAFLTRGFDLGNVDQALWSTTQGRILQYTNWPGGTNRFGNHFEPILLLVSLSYLIHSGPETLLVLQSIVIALGAWPIYRLTGRRLENDWMGALFASVYLLFPGLQAANTFDFHAVALAPTLLAWALWSIEEKRYQHFVVWGLLAMACKEEMPIVVAIMGLWLLARGERRLGVVTVVVGVTWTALALLVIIPSLNTLDVSPQLGRYSHLGKGPKEMLANLVIHPDLYISTLTEPLKIQYLIKLYFPTGYLALLAPHVLLIAAPSFAVNLLSSRPHMIALDKFHYTAPIAPFVIIASAYGVALMARWMGRVFRHVDRRFLLVVWSGYVLVLTFSYHRIYGVTPLARYFAWPKVAEHERIGHQLIEEIPAHAAVSAQNQLNPHLTQRKKIYVFPRLEDAEYALVDVTSYPYIEPVEDFHTAVRDLLVNPDFGVVTATDGYILFQRGAGSEELPRAFYSAFQLPEQTDHRKARASFGTGLALTDVAWQLEERGGVLAVETIWLRQTEQVVGDEIVVELIDSSAGGQLEEEQELVLSRWYPPQEWPIGQPVRDVARLIPPAGVPLETLRIGLIYRSLDGERLPVTPGEDRDWYQDPSGTVLLVPLEEPLD